MGDPAACPLDPALASDPLYLPTPHTPRSLGPYVVQAETPIGQVWLAERQHRTPEDLAEESEVLFDRTTRMYALARLLLGDVNIAATTALQVKHTGGGWSFTRLVRVDLTDGRTD